jgi:hypothetical protein
MFINGLYMMTSFGTRLGASGVEQPRQLVILAGSRKGISQWMDREKLYRVGRIDSLT